MPAKTLLGLGLIAAVLLLLLGGDHAMAVTPTAREMRLARAWGKAKFAERAGASAGEMAPRDSLPAFSFTYAGQPSARILPGWKSDVTMETRDGHSECVRRWRDPATGIEARAEATLYDDFPAVEWVICFKNTGHEDAPILENVSALDLDLTRGEKGEFVLHHALGGVASFDDFAPIDETLGPGAKVRLIPTCGRSSHQRLPFYNIEAPGGGVVMAIGWTGEWVAQFERRGERVLNVRAGMELTHLRLHPGEEIRTPRILLIFWKGDDRIRGHNLLRRFILKHHRPHPGGKPLVSPVTTGNWGATRAEVHIENIKKIAEHRLPLEYYWIDAGWFGSGDWPTSVGDWDYNPRIYPNGMRAVSDAAHERGIKFQLWFEPERVFEGTKLWRQHPEWLLKLPGNQNAIFNLGDPKARAYLTDLISRKITEYGVDCYRQDFNIDPLDFWRAADAPDRQGVTEIRYIEGLYAFWDTLLGRHPNLIIDNCASGGRRIDLEMTGRGTPLWRSDGPRDPIAHQCHTYGLLFRVPFSATSEDRAPDTYDFRSGMCSSLCTNWWHHADAPGEPIPADFPYDWAREMLLQHRAIRPYYEGDYYPLTPYSKAEDVWLAYQLDRDDLGQGMVVAFRRPKAEASEMTLKLRGLKRASTYEVRFVDTGERRKMTGRALMERGLVVKLPAPRSSALVVYKRQMK
jgi:alpha-galactosidase